MPSNIKLIFPNAPLNPTKAPLIADVSATYEATPVIT